MAYVHQQVIPDRVNYSQKLHKLILCQSPYFKRRILNDATTDSGGVGKYQNNGKSNATNLTPATLDISVIDPNVTTESLKVAIGVLYGGPLPSPTNAFSAAS